jgi:hypothetical protein
VLETVVHDANGMLGQAMDGGWYLHNHWEGADGSSELDAKKLANRARNARTGVGGVRMHGVRMGVSRRTQPPGSGKSRKTQS